ncbi:MAG: antitoxin VapB family protein [candidate division NC10 bacterium]
MKTVSFDDEAYHLLKGAKVSPRDSFSDVVKRNFGARPEVRDSAGSWSDVSEDRLAQLRKERRVTFGTTGG